LHCSISFWLSKIVHHKIDDKHFTSHVIFCGGIQWYKGICCSFRTVVAVPISGQRSRPCYLTTALRIIVTDAPFISTRLPDAMYCADTRFVLPSPRVSPHDAMLARYMPWSRVCTSVCLSQVGVLSKRSKYHRTIAQEI